MCVQRHHSFIYYRKKKVDILHDQKWLSHWLRTNGFLSFRIHTVNPWQRTIIHKILQSNYCIQAIHITHLALGCIYFPSSSSFVNQYLAHLWFEFPSNISIYVSSIILASYPCLGLLACTYHMHAWLFCYDKLTTEKQNNISKKLRNFVVFLGLVKHPADKVICHY